MVSTDTKVVALFVVLGVASLYATAAVTDSTAVQMTVLLIVGVVAPTLVNEYRRESA